VKREVAQQEIKEEIEEEDEEKYSAMLPFISPSSRTNDPPTR
jgi:hypothetical protein